MKYRIFLPRDYQTSSRRYPVLYLLHGWHGDYQNWSTLTKLTQYAADLPLIIVMPDADDSWYVDSAESPQDKFESYVIHDVIDEVDQHWRTVRASHRRAIAGLSMGGYGAVKLALRFPNVFHFAGSISGAFNAADPELGSARTDLQPSLLKAFGPAGSKTREKDDVYLIVEKVPVDTMPRLYIDCGSRDISFLKANRALAAQLSDRSVNYEYHEYPGAHTWQYWDQRLSALLAVVNRSIASDGR